MSNKENRLKGVVLVEWLLSYKVRVVPTQHEHDDCQCVNLTSDTKGNPTKIGLPLVKNNTQHL